MEEVKKINNFDFSKIQEMLKSALVNNKIQAPLNGLAGVEEFMKTQNNEELKQQINSDEMPEDIKKLMVEEKTEIEKILTKKEYSKLYGLTKKGEKLFKLYFILLTEGVDFVKFSKNSCILVKNLHFFSMLEEKGLASYIKIINSDGEMLYAQTKDEIIKSTGIMSVEEVLCFIEKIKINKTNKKNRSK